MTKRLMLLRSGSTTSVSDADDQWLLQYANASQAGSHMLDGHQSNQGFYPVHHGRCQAQASRSQLIDSVARTGRTTDSPHGNFQPQPVNAADRAP